MGWEVCGRGMAGGHLTPGACNRQYMVVDLEKTLSRACWQQPFSSTGDGRGEQGRTCDTAWAEMCVCIAACTHAAFLGPDLLRLFLCHVAHPLVQQVNVWHFLQTWCPSAPASTRYARSFTPRHASHAAPAAQEMHDGLLWVVEQIPGLVVDADMTPTLALGYWPSFNVPFFPEVRSMRGGATAWGLPHLLTLILHFINLNKMVSLRPLIATMSEVAVEVLLAVLGQPAGVGSHLHLGWRFATLALLNTAGKQAPGLRPAIQFSSFCDRCSCAGADGGLPAGQPGRLGPSSLSPCS